MKTYSPDNRQNSYTLSSPIKQTKHQKIPTVANYALILLKVYQDNQGGYTKKDLVGQALGPIDDNYKTWDNWDTAAAFCMEFSAFNHNLLLEYKPERKLWFWGCRMTEYLKFHFENCDFINLDGYPYNDALKHNEYAKAVNEQARKDYKIGKEIFFQ